MFFHQKLESAGGNPVLKKLAASKLIELKESYMANMKPYGELETYGKLETLIPKYFLFCNIIFLEFCGEDLTIYLFKLYAKIG